MAVYSDMNGFPEAGFPALTDESDRLVLNTLYTVPQKYLNYIIDVNGNNRLLGALVLGGAITGVTTITMAGALAGVTTIGASQTVTLSSATAPLTMTGIDAALIMSGARASIGTYLQRINKGYFKNLDILNRPTVGEDLVALVSDLRTLAQDSYTNLTPMPEKVGGWDPSSTFEGKTMNEMWTGLLYPYQYPAFNTFTIQSQTTPLEVGASIAANRVFTWTTNLVGDDNINAGSIVIRDVTGAADIATGLNYTDTPYTSTYAAITKTTATTNQFSITGTNSKSQTFNKTYTVTWQWRIYYGTSASTSLDQTGIKALLNKPLASTVFGNKSFVAGDYKYICFPATFTPPNSFKDSAGLLVAMTQLDNVDVTNEVIGNPQTTTYKVYRTSYPQVAALTITIA